LAIRTTRDRIPAVADPLLGCPEHRWWSHGGGILGGAGVAISASTKTPGPRLPTPRTWPAPTCSGGSTSRRGAAGHRVAWLDEGSQRGRPRNYFQDTLDALDRAYLARGT
jgi:hypothetical protein